MKRVIIGEKCIGCGICLHNKKYIEETTDGIARAIPGMMVTDKDLPDLEEIERICPIHELHLSPLKKETADSRVLSESKERGVRIFFWTILVVLTLSLSFLCILLDSCRPR